ncbi:MAG: methyltransferase domain-containing protein [Nitrospirae bacterium YQR-1]
MEIDDFSKIKEGVKGAYSAVATEPDGKHPFPVGRLFALSLGYPEELLDDVPSLAVESFTGVSNVSVFAGIKEGDRVCDVGCGVGLDAFIAARRAGANGKVTGVDFSAQMIEKAQRAKAQGGSKNTDFIVAEAEKIPLSDNSASVVLANGIFNLNPVRDVIFKEILRILKPGGMVFGAELVLTTAPVDPLTCSLNNWFA